MTRYPNHIKRSWKAFCLLASVFQMMTLVYVIASLLKGTFKIEDLLYTIAGCLLFGIIVALGVSGYEIMNQDIVKKTLSSIDLRKLGTGKFKLIDEYRNGWGRAILIEGSFQKKKVHIQCRLKRGHALSLIFLVELEKEFYEEAATMKLTEGTPLEAINRVLVDAIAASNDPKFGEIYWELKRRKERNRLR